MQRPRRRTFLVGAAVALAGCTGGSDDSSGGSPSSTSTSDLDTVTEPPPDEFARPRVRRHVIKELNAKRREYGYASLQRNEPLRKLAQDRAAAAAKGQDVEEEGVRLARVDCENGGEIVAVVPLGSPVERPGDESGTTVIETTPELASYLGEYWTVPGSDRQTLLTGSFSRVGIGSYVGEQAQKIAVAASLCE